MKREKTIHSTVYSQLVERLHQERKRLGLSQMEVAQELGMTQSEISKIESTERRLDIFEFKKLLSIYRVNENETLKQFVLNFLSLE